MRELGAAGLPPSPAIAETSHQRIWVRPMPGVRSPSRLVHVACQLSLAMACGTLLLPASPCAPHSLLHFTGLHHLRTCASPHTAAAMAALAATAQAVVAAKPNVFAARKVGSPGSNGGAS